MISPLLCILPRPLRDRLYAFVAHNRLRFFGKRATCCVPDAGDEDRFPG
jgi:predicted DCC family thiol-disulfide oxidoreductase YuxK